MTIDPQQRANEILEDIRQIQYSPAEIPRAERLGEIRAAVDSCIQAFRTNGASTEFISQLEQMKGKC